MAICIRKAMPEDLDSIYLMGIDVWSDGSTEKEYLSECRSSPKYKKGEWFVLVDSQDNPISSLITYMLAENTIGIGSIATPKSLRKQGYASELIRGVISHYESKEQTRIFFLFADIESKFYEKFEFISLPIEYQKYKSSTCMVRCSDFKELLSQSAFKPPTYF